MASFQTGRRLKAALLRARLIITFTSPLSVSRSRPDLDASDRSRPPAAAREPMETVPPSQPRQVCPTGSTVAKFAFKSVRFRAISLDLEDNKSYNQTGYGRRCTGTKPDSSGPRILDAKGATGRGHSTVLFFATREATPGSALQWVRP